MTFRLRLLIVVLFLVFSLQFLSQVMFRTYTPKNGSQSETAVSLFPIDPEPMVAHAHKLLTMAQETPDEKNILESIRCLQKAAAINPLYYQAHFFMAKAYLLLNRSNSDDFARGMISLKRAARIRRNNVRVITDTLKVLFSLWPHLDEGDRKYAASLFQNSAKNIQKKELDSLLESWGLYVRDTSLLTEVLDSAPRHLLGAANTISRFGMDLSIRHRLLDRYESYQLGMIREGTRKNQNDPEKFFSNLMTLEKSLSRRIRGYHRLVPNGDFDEKKLEDLKDFLKKNMLRSLFKSSRWKRDPKVQGEIVSIASKSVQETNQRELLEFYSEFLTGQRFFEIQSLRVFYLHQLLQFRLNRFDKVVFEIESFRKTLSYVKKESAEDHIKLLYLLADAYIASRLLSKAQLVLDEVEKISPGNLETRWRRMQVEAVFGPVESVDGKSEGLGLEIAESRIIRINGKRLKKTVYRVDSGPLEIRISDSLWGKLSRQNLVQVFVNNQIKLERYAKAGDQIFEVDVPSREIFEKLLVEIRVIQ